MTRLLLWMALGVVVLGAAVLGRPVALRWGLNRPRFEYSGSALSEGAYAALARHEGWSALSLGVQEGISLRGLVRRPHEPRSSWVLFFPGNDASQLAHSQEFLEHLARGRDWGLLVYAYRGYDSSAGRPGPETLAADGARIFHSLLKDEAVPPSRVHLVAFSLGAYVAVHTAAEAAKAQERVASLSLIAGVGNVEMNRSAWGARLSIGDVYLTLPLLELVAGPVLVVHGASDQTLSVETGRQITARLRERARYVEIPGAGHELMFEESAVRAVREMIDKASLGGG